MDTVECEKPREPRIFGLKIVQPVRGCYKLKFEHVGDFTLGDYEELELEVISSRLVKRVGGDWG